ncbi:hypothetical protein NC651_030779 [Populus alba x Populus x berolinensis]|uniref:Uncharacterized protein n=1 Tax=Populus alba TaxID=43335 RepID=A0ACC4B771_POPAL|nr:hypothetical protein NC651_030779 [Populus alba x Populus x berolinensis]
MRCSNSCMNFICFLVALSLVCALMGGSQARPLHRGKLSGFQTDGYEAGVRTLGAKLPKGAPLPPSGPSPAIN